MAHHHDARAFGQSALRRSHQYGGFVDMVAAPQLQCSRVAIEGQQGFTDILGVFYRLEQFDMNGDGQPDILADNGGYNVASVFIKR